MADPAAATVAGASNEASAAGGSPRPSPHGSPRPGGVSASPSRSPCGTGGGLPYEPGSEENGLEDPWNLARVALGSLAGEPWRVKRALAEPTKAFELCPAPESGSWWEQLRRTQTYDDFKSRLIRPDFSNRTVDVILFGNPDHVRRKIHLGNVLVHLEAFIGFPVSLRNADVRFGDWACPRQAADGREQVAAHLLLGKLEDMADPRSACTVGLTVTDLYLPQGSSSHVAGASDAERRLGVFSIARYTHTGNSPLIDIKEALSKIAVKVLCRECLKLCGMGECRLLRCLMNPCPGGRPEAVNALPLSLCCICLRKLNWLSQVDLLDRYAYLPRVFAAWFEAETEWLEQRQAQVGMPTYGSLQTPKFPEPDPTKFGK